MTDLTYHSLPAWLVAALPELREVYEDELDWWAPDMPGPHIVAGDILTPFLAEVLAHPDDPAFLTRAFSAIESLASSSDPAIRDVVGVSILPGLLEDEKLMTTAAEYFGPVTQRMVDELHRWRPTRRSGH